VGAAYGQKITGIPARARRQEAPSAIVRTVRSWSPAVDFTPGIVAIYLPVFARK
jgi:hypothetical protein